MRLLREFDPASAGRGVDELDVPDPTTAARGGFEDVLDLVHAACAGLLEELRARLHQVPERREGPWHSRATFDQRAPVRVSLPPGASDARRVGGGDINEAWRVTLADGGAAFVKTRADAGPGEYAAEAAGLRWLAEPGALRTPRVIDARRGLPRAGVDRARAPGRGGRRGARARAGVTHAAGAAGFGDPPGRRRRS